MEIILLIGRIIFGGFFFISGVSHFTDLKSMSAYAASKGTPAPKLAVVGSGLLMLLGGLGVILGAYVDISLILIAIFLFFASPKMHAFWKETDPNTRMSEKINFMKNMALLGATLALYALSSAGWPLSFSL